MYFFYLNFLIFFVTTLAKLDYYNLLGVSNDADTRTIRKAFKKLAMQKHPDKNKDDPKAHDVFVQINRAYEVLKDDDLRKKYDEHGEAGLDNNFNSNQQYQSWQFYKDNFGIYDDDIEIVTLSRVDFQDEVLESNELWFINFYSTFCSHCHALAPIWRKFAKSMDKIIRIGAVNCAEDPGLCQSQYVRGYPSLVVYPHHEFYQGIRDVKSLTEFIVSKLNSPIYQIFSINDINRVWYNQRVPFVIEFCNQNKKCFSNFKRKKIASVLNTIANFGVIDCSSTKEETQKICKTLMNNGIAYYPYNKFNKENEKIIKFNSNYKDFYSTVLNNLPEIKQITSQELQDLLVNDGINEKFTKQNTVVIFFANLQNLDVEFKKLQLLNFVNLTIYFGDCKKLKTECYQLLNLKNLPKVVFFKANGGFDINYSNKISLNIVENFLQKSVLSSLITLTDKTYYNIIKTKNNDLLLIDHFAPWCPPCLKLIPELRKLPAKINGRRLRVATLDCEAYKSICSKSKINSYPSTILYAKNTIFTSVGYHSAEDIIEFIEDSLNPAVKQLDYNSFEEIVVKRPQGHFVLVDFYANWCGPCQKLAPEFRKLARSFSNNSAISFGIVDCEIQRSLCTKNNIQSYPSIQLFDSSQTMNPEFYPSNWWRDFKSMQHWLNEKLPSLVKLIIGNLFPTIKSSKKPVLVDFYAPWCSHCITFAPTLEKIAQLLENEVQVLKVNCEMTPYICQQVSITAYPTLRLFLKEQKKNFDGLQIQPESDPNSVAIKIREILKKHKIATDRTYDEL